jgi:uncharacterized membrane protein YfcA
MDYIFIFAAGTANGTNRIALIAQNLSAVLNFKRKGFFYPKLILLLGIPAVIGSIVGSSFAVNLSDELFNKILGVVMVVMLVLILTRPEKKFLGDKEITELVGKRKIISIVALFFVGFYGGFIQGGVGFLFIVTLSLITGMSLVKINSLKVAVVGMYTVTALSVFVINGHVDWGLGLFLAIGNSTGAYLGSNFAVNKGDRYIRIIISIALIVMAGRLWGLWL